MATAAKFDEKSEYAARMKKNPEVYQYLKERLNQHFEEKKAK